MMHVSGVRHN